ICRRCDDRGRPKEKAGRKPCSKNCVDPVALKYRIYRVFLQGCAFVGAGLPPETWTTRWDERKGPNRSEGLVLTDDFRAVTFFSNNCSISQQTSYEIFHASASGGLDNRYRSLKPQFRSACSRVVAVGLPTLSA